MKVREPRRVLAVRVGRMGDLVMLTPALRMLLDGLPEAEVHVLTTAEGRRVLRGFDPRLAAFHLYHRRFPDGLLMRGRLLRVLRSLRFDRVYLFESHSHYAKLVRGLAPELHGFTDPPRSAHYAARCLDVVEPTIAHPVARGWLTLPVTDPGRTAASAYLSRHGLTETDLLVGLHLTFSESSRGAFASGRGRRHREWPVSQCAALARLLVEHGRKIGVSIRPILDALPEELDVARALAERAGGTITVLSGAPDFERYKALLERMRVLVTPNTGPMHVAAAVGTPVVALFSGWSPADCGPFVPPARSAVLRAEDSERADQGLAAISAGAAFEICRDFLQAG
ncbi:MAG: glycosyltransferase family 9 protein [Candidatus Eisenbacteria bacterium]